jgi:hypothetical protein
LDRIISGKTFTRVTFRPSPAKQTDDRVFCFRASTVARTRGAGLQEQVRMKSLPDRKTANQPAVPPAPAERAAAIGSRLRRIFDEAAAEPLPQAFEDLLRKLG